jgi:4a-hydroxytetrahydrobiopterin dehydratase
MPLEILKEEQISEALKNISGWSFKDGHIVKTFYTQGYPETMGFVTAIGCVCQKINHHPDFLVVKYKEVDVSFSTHALNGITEYDLKAALEINKLI